MELYRHLKKTNYSETSILTCKQSNHTKSINLKGVGNSMLKS